MSQRSDPFKDKLALITGGSSGIGLALAIELSHLGARVCICGRRPQTLQAAAEQIRLESGLACTTATLDVADAAAVADFFSQLARQQGVPDLVINSAGVTRPGYVQDLELDVFRQMMEINYFGTVNVVKAVLPAMLARGSGQIVNIASGAAFIGLFGYSAYGASKYAVRGFTDVLRAEMKPHGLQVAVVFPPDTDTPQLAYELPFKPPETKALTGSASVQSPQAVARAILKGLRRRRYVILPGADTWLFYHLSNLLGNGVYLILDAMVAAARRKARPGKTA